MANQTTSNNPNSSVVKHNDSDNIFFSIIIPYYNGQNTIKKCIDSIYRQGLELTEFEIIVVDDCSPNSKAWEYLVQLCKDDTYANVRLLRTEQNLRQGGARNLGISQARGEYIFSFDNDDWLSDNALNEIKKVLIDNSLDILMFDFCECYGDNLVYNSNYYKNSQIVQTGVDFICSNEIPWSPWCFIYNKQFLLNNDLKYEEKVRFEDADFVMKATLLAKRITFRPIIAVKHLINSVQTSNIGNDISKIYELLFIAYRVRQIAEQFKSEFPKGANVVMTHHYFMYKASLRKLIWRIPKDKILDVLNKYPAEEHSPDWLTQLSIKHPRFLAYSFATVRPILNGLWHIKRLIKH
jgi:glycosyltransferase involved in cell wall biosynthesis